jgi:SAM-dependent methyltransferase
MTDRDRLRATFDSAAQLYQEARPDYPAALYDELVRLAGLRTGDRLLEVGCATGKATVPLARRGFRITCVEIGGQLADAARRNLAAFPDVEVVSGAFETWRPVAPEVHQPAGAPEVRQPAEPGAGFDLVFAATAWHWIDPAVKYRRAWELLRPAGHLAVWEAGHVFSVDGDPFFGEIQEVYDEIGEGVPAGRVCPRPGEQGDDSAEIEGSGLFEDVAIRHFDWEVSYTAEEYIRLLKTFSGHIAMEQWKRDRLYGEIRARLAERDDGRVRRHWGAVLQVTRRRDD